MPSLRSTPNRCQSSAASWRDDWAVPSRPALTATRRKGTPLATNWATRSAKASPRPGWVWSSTASGRSWASRGATPSPANTCPRSSIK